MSTSPKSEQPSQAAHTPEDASYEALQEFFKTHQDELVEIEVLPPALAPVEGFLLQDGKYLGVPKRVLVQAFLTARNIFLANKTNLSLQSVSGCYTFEILTDTKIARLIFLCSSSRHTRQQI